MNTEESHGDKVCDMDGCRLTVVIPVYDRADRVGATLRSVEAQTLRPLKVVLVDNNSTDNTLQVLDDWKRRVEKPGFEVTVVGEKRPGAAAARNRGLQEVATPLTMFFDSDDIMAPEHCQRAVAGFDDNPGVDIVGWDCWAIGRDGKRYRYVFCEGDAMWANLFYGSMATLRYAARTDLFRRAGGWNPECLGWDDIEMGFRMLVLRPSIRKLKNNPTARICLLPDSITGDSFSAKAPIWEHALDLIEDAIPDGDRRVARYVNFRRAVLAGDYRRERALDDSRRLLDISLSNEPSRFYRLLNRVAVFYRGLGLPGIARLLRPLFP